MGMPGTHALGAGHPLTPGPRAHRQLRTSRHQHTHQLSRSRCRGSSPRTHQLGNLHKLKRPKRGRNLLVLSIWPLLSRRIRKRHPVNGQRRHQDSPSLLHLSISFPRHQIRKGKRAFLQRGHLGPQTPHQIKLLLIALLGHIQTGEVTACHQGSQANSQDPSPMHP